MTTYICDHCGREFNDRAVALDHMATVHGAATPNESTVDVRLVATTVCDRCGDEIAVDEANYAGPELPTWEGATLCNECYAAEVSS